MNRHTGDHTDGDRAASVDSVFRALARARRRHLLVVVWAAGGLSVETAARRVREAERRTRLPAAGLFDGDDDGDGGDDGDGEATLTPRAVSPTATPDGRREPTADETAAVRTELRHVHIPVLTDAGLVDYDHTREWIEQTAATKVALSAAARLERTLAETRHPGSR